LAVHCHVYIRGRTPEDIEAPRTGDGRVLIQRVGRVIELTAVRSVGVASLAGERAISEIVVVEGLLPSGEQFLAGEALDGGGDLVAVVVTVVPGGAIL